MTSSAPGSTGDALAAMPAAPANPLRLRIIARLSTGHGHDRAQLTDGRVTAARRERGLAKSG